MLIVFSSVVKPFHDEGVTEFEGDGEGRIAENGIRGWDCDFFVAASAGRESEHLDTGDVA